ncbi:hypothetical protein DL96DRAFT_1459008, partial [Flagelloscypha sp. PMI_526]
MDSSSRIPTLKVCDKNRHVVRTADTNDLKAELFINAFFKELMSHPADYTNYEYPEPLPEPQEIQDDQIIRAFNKMKLYKAPGDDSIPNVVLKQTVMIILPYVKEIYRAILRLRRMPGEWLCYITIVLRKPGKPDYTSPKAWRPIALLRGLRKGLCTIVTEDLIHLTKKHGLLPKMQFGG